MKILTTSAKNEPKNIFTGTITANKSETGVILRENRSTGADKRIKVHCVELTKKEAYTAFKACLSGYSLKAVNMVEIVLKARKRAFNFNGSVKHD